MTNKNFTNWLNQLKDIAVDNHGFSKDIIFDGSAFYDYYQQKFTPNQALIEDFNQF